MKKLFTKIVACVAVVSLVATMGLTALASKEMDNMEFVCYDLTNPYAPNKVYNEVIDGKFTNKSVLVPVDYEWRNDGGFEGEYPYAGYDTMYIEGQAQKIYQYNSLFPQWESRRQDFFWEINGKHTIWERHQTYARQKDGSFKWQWDFGNEKFGISDRLLLTETVREAVVVNEEYLPYGFAWYNNAGQILSLEEEQEMYKYFGIYDEAITGWVELTKESDIPGERGNNEYKPEIEGILSVDSLSRTDDYNRYVMTDEDIAKVIPAVYSKYVTAKFNKDSDEGLATKNVAYEYLANEVYPLTRQPEWLIEEKANWKWDADSLVIAPAFSIDWTAPAFEMDEPYQQYQYLIVNGIVLDGKDGSPEVLRYTSGKELPVVEWKFERFDYVEMPEKFPYPIFQVVEAKYVDGVKAFDKEGNAIYRYPTGEYGSVYFEQNKEDDTLIELWVADEKGNKELLEVFENFTGTLESAIEAWYSGNHYMNRVIAEDQYALLP